MKLTTKLAVGAAGLGLVAGRLRHQRLRPRLRQGLPELRRRAGGRPLAAVALGRLGIGAFRRTLRLPPRLAPGRYRVAFIGPGGTLRTTLTLRAPREGVIGSGSVAVTGAGAVALFRMAAPPRSLAGRLSVTWSQGPRRLAVVAVDAGALIRATLPAGAELEGGRLRAELRAGRVVVGSALSAQQ